MPSDRLTTAAADVLARAQAQGLKIVTAESCTGGLIAASLTDIAGSSAVVDRGFVTYSNESKVEMLGVPGGLIAQYGAVSAEVAIAMAEGALAHSHADIAVSVTGIAGPGGGSDAKPIGLVHFAATRKGGCAFAEERRFGDIGRQAVREASAEFALSLIVRLL